MFGIIYETTNKVNGKTYIGQHICTGSAWTCNPKKGICEYLGSGVFLKRAIEKYGRENFTRRTLVKASVDRLNWYEAKFVTPEWAAQDTNYNYHAGGTGKGSLKLSEDAKAWWARMTPEYKVDYLRRRTAEAQKVIGKGMRGAPTQEHRNKIAEGNRRAHANPEVKARHAEARERKIAKIKKTIASRTPKQQAAINKKVSDTRKKTCAAMTPKQRRNSTQKANEGLRARLAAMTPKQRSEYGRTLGAGKSTAIGMRHSCAPCPIC